MVVHIIIITICCCAQIKTPAMLKQRRSALNVLVSTCSVAQRLKPDSKTDF